MMKVARFAGLFLLPALLAAGAGITPVQPKNFPRVDLSPGSIPYYSAVMLDVETNQIGYIMFDGNVSNGYDRLYFWVPDDMNYRTPKTLRLNSETKRFGPVKFQPRHGKDDIRIDWSFTWGRSGGSYDSFDYMTGKSRRINAGIYPRFYFSCDYARQPRGGGRTDNLVDITIPGEIGGASIWTNLPAPLEPWHTLNYYMAKKLVRDKDNTLVHFNGVLNYGGHRCEVRSLPRETVCTLMVIPYMEKPTYSNDMGWAEAFVNGIELKLEYRWYDFYWNIACPGLNVYPRLDYDVRGFPFPITRFED